MSQSTQIVTRRGAQKAKIQTRATVRGLDPPATTNKAIVERKISPALVEAKKRAKEKKKMQQNSTTDTNQLNDIYFAAINSIKSIRHKTGLIYDNRMARHKCLWDPTYPECPERFTRCIERCNQLKLIDRCEILTPRPATLDEIRLKHTQKHIDILRETKDSNDPVKLEKLSAQYDAVYFHPTTYDLSLLATGSTIELIDNILSDRIQNGMAIIRPPGHHAMKSEFNGFCYFNNVAIAAQSALNRGVDRILIVDWDVHHGQATQQMFYDDPRVLYFSIHRYEWGEFWPNLRESNFDAIGDGTGRGFNFNVPLNQIGMKNSDYLAIFQQILMPVAIEGEMEVTPQFYPHLLHPLMSLANGKVAVILEGGYCLSSLAEGAANTLRTLLGDPCPLVEPLTTPSDSILDSILNCIYSHRPYWRCLQTNETYTLEDLNNVNPQPDLHKVVRLFKGSVTPIPKPGEFLTKDFHRFHSTERFNEIEHRLKMLKISTNLNYPASRACFVYDDFMTKHYNIHEIGHPERPERITEIKKRFVEFNLLDRMKSIPSRFATDDEISLVHTQNHITELRRMVGNVDDLFENGERFNSIYLHSTTFECAAMSAGSVLQIVDEVVNGNSRTGLGIVRPPGHHAEPNEPHGFCIFNNVAIAAQYAINCHGLKRVLIVDWDVHHGNGTQHIFESNPNVLYISVHRYDYGQFFPKGPDGDFGSVGIGSGEGFNVNIPWNRKGMGDSEYAAVFQRIIMPIAYEFNPELVIISAGFDAAIGDPLGGCKVTPEAYAHFTHWLSALANGRCIICLEGGYNINSISHAMAMCAKALLGDPLPPLRNCLKLHTSCVETIQNVLSIQMKYWKALRFGKRLPETDIEFDRIDDQLKSLIIDDQQPGPSTDQSKSNNQTLVDYLSENIHALYNEDMYAVVPLSTCPHLIELVDKQLPDTINISIPCEQCQSETENWFCLICYHTYCGRYVNEHMMYHYLDTEHPLTLSYADLSVWCYKCEAYIDNATLFPYKNLAHRNKFGEDMVWSYGSTAVLHMD